MGLLELTDEGIQARDALVIDACAVRSIPVAVAIGGGYSPDHENIVERHVSVHRAARDALQVQLLFAYAGHAAPLRSERSCPLLLHQSVTNAQNPRQSPLWHRNMAHGGVSS